MSFTENKKPERLELNVYRTVSGTVIEVVTAVINIALWVITILAIIHSGSDGAGPTALFPAPQEMGSVRSLLISAIVCTGLSAFALNAAYHPLSSVNMPMNITSVAQLVHMVTYTRMTAINLSCLSLSICLTETNLKTIASVLTCIFLAIMLLTSIYFTIKVYRARNREKKTKWNFFK